MQRETTELRDVEQLSLLPDRAVKSLPPDITHIRMLRSTKAALEYACLLANLVPKAIYSHMDYDKTAWSRICSGERDLAGRDIRRFCRVVGNNAYLLYLNHEAGFDLASIRAAQDDKDRQLAEKDQEIADLKRAMRLWVEAQKAGTR